MEGEYLTQTLDERNSGILEAWFPFWVANTFMNYRTVLEEFQREDMSMLSEPRREFKVPAVVLGSGPSLDKWAPLLRDWRGAIFCAASNGCVPMRWGRQPEYVGVFDAGDIVVNQIKGFNWEGSTLLTHPAVSPLVMQEWKWRKRYYCMMHQGHNWFETVMPIVFGSWNRPIIVGYEKPAAVNAAVLNAGCIANNLVQIAHHMQYDPLFLLGVDFGYLPDRERCTTYRVGEDGGWVAIPSPNKPPDRKLHLSDNGMLTTEEQIEYKTALLAIWKLDFPQLFDCSEGIITELPKADFKEVAKTNGECVRELYLSREEIIRRANAVLLRRQDVRPERDDNRPDQAVRAAAGGVAGLAEDGNGSGRRRFARAGRR